MGNGSIVWIASYPKSGNTWMRSFLSDLLEADDEPFNINELAFNCIASSRELFNDCTGIDSSDLLPDEIEVLRPSVFRSLSKKVTRPFFVKAHEAWDASAGEQRLFPTDATQLVIYLLRNPLDIASSLAHHHGYDIDKAISEMADPNFSLIPSTGNIHPQFPQIVRTWSHHVKSWTEQQELPLLVLRYEDISSDKFLYFSSVVKSLELQVDSEKIRQSIENTAFEQLSKQEFQNGFREKLPRSTFFFRKGKVGAWKEELNQQQIIKIISSHEEMMYRWGYLDSQGNPN